MRPPTRRVVWSTVGRALGHFGLGCHFRLVGRTSYQYQDQYQHQHQYQHQYQSQYWCQCTTNERTNETLLRMLHLLCAPMALALSNMPYDIIRSASVVNPLTGAAVSPLDDLAATDTDGRTVLRAGDAFARQTQRQKCLVVLLPQLGEFDSAEMCEHLVAVYNELHAADMALRVIGIGNVAAAENFAAFTGLPLDCLRVDPEAALHRALGLHAGPQWTFPDAVSDTVLELLLSTLPGGKPSDPALLRPTADAWLRYLAMCAGISAPGTLSEIFRGYVGDKQAPERLAPDAVVKASFVEIGPGVGPVKLGPLEYTNSWANEVGYQRPVELATVRLRNMVEVLSNWDGYVSNPTAIAQRGATYIFSTDGTVEHEYRHRGVLTYSETMARPLSFLAPYLGEARARNPLGLGDSGGVQ